MRLFCSQQCLRLIQLREQIRPLLVDTQVVIRSAESTQHLSVFSDRRAIAFRNENVHVSGVERGKQLIVIRIGDHICSYVVLFEVIVEHAYHCAVQNTDLLSIHCGRIGSDIRLRLLLDKIV